MARTTHHDQLTLTCRRPRTLCTYRDRAGATLQTQFMKIGRAQDGKTCANDTAYTAAPKVTDSSGSSPQARSLGGVLLVTVALGLAVLYC